ncbi:MAG: AhpC/TSA family protein [Bacteroidales bacterium]|nr:AhpC/TSA family protein [Bacteroidales bacterium]
MKRIIYLIFVAALFSSCSSEPHFVVKGKIDESDSVKFLLMKREAGRYVIIDSAVSKKGNFKMTGTIEFPDMVQLIAVNRENRTSFYLENSRITITGKLDSLFNAKITGSKTQDEYRYIIDTRKPLSEKYSDLYLQYQTASQVRDTAKVAQLENEIESVMKEMIALQKDFIKNNPASFLAPTLLNDFSYEMEAEEIEAALNAMDTNVAKIPLVKEMKDRVARLKTVSVGQKAPDFTLNNVDGNPVALSSKVGSKILLIDFWAAWCNPCRQENPNIVKVYNEFHKKGFDVLGVSLDSNKEAWIKAIANDKLSWTQVTDLEQYESSAAKLYAVDAIPSNFLLDETGTIIARNVRGQALYDKVNGVLGK